MAEFVRYTMEDGSAVVFAAAESNLVEQTRLGAVAAAAEQVARSLRSELKPEEIELEFGLKVSAEMNWWFFAKNQAEGTIKVTLMWKPSAGRIEAS